MTRTRTGAALAALLVVSVLAGLGLLAYPAFTAQGKGKGPLEGTWTAVAMTQSGKKLPAEGVKLFQLTFSGNKVITTFRIADESRTGTFKVDGSKQPKQFDMQLLGE